MRLGGAAVLVFASNTLGCIGVSVGPTLSPERKVGWEARLMVDFPFAAVGPVSFTGGGSAGGGNTRLDPLPWNVAASTDVGLQVLSPGHLPSAHLEAFYSGRLFLPDRASLNGVGVRAGILAKVGTFYLRSCDIHVLLGADAAIDHTWGPFQRTIIVPAGTVQLWQRDCRRGDQIASGAGASWR